MCACVCVCVLVRVWRGLRSNNLIMIPSDSHWTHFPGAVPINLRQALDWAQPLSNPNQPPPTLLRRLPPLLTPLTPLRSARRRRSINEIRQSSSTSRQE